MRSLREPVKLTPKSRHAIHSRFKMHPVSRLNSHSSESAAHQEGKSPFGINRVDESLEGSPHLDAVDLSDPHGSPSHSVGVPRTSTFSRRPIPSFYGSPAGPMSRPCKPYQPMQSLLYKASPGFSRSSSFGRTQRGR